MTTLLVQMLGTDTRSHAALPGASLALCGMGGTGLLARVLGAFDVTCPRCSALVVERLGLTPLTDPTNVHMRVVEEDS